MNKWYVGAGSSDTPADVLELMKKLAGVMSGKGVTLRCSETGNADKAFVTGSKGRFFTFIPHGLIDESLDVPDAKPYWCSVWGIPSDLNPQGADATFARKLNPGFLTLSRLEKQWEIVANSLMYGSDGQSLAKMLVCWTPDGARKAEEITDGTGHVARYIRAAHKAGVTVLNLAVPQDRAKIESWTR